MMQSRFDIDPMSKEWIMRSISWKWKDWKAKVKIRHYYPYKTDEERLAHCDERVQPDQWPVFVKLWSTEEMQKVNRSDGKEPSRAELFIMTRTRKNGKPINEASSETKLRDRAKDQNSPMVNNKQGNVLLEIIGADKKGRPRCLELGPSPAEFGGLKRSHAETIRMVSEAKSEIQEVKEKMAIMEQTCAHMAS
ncbi:hypothetical protein BUALT_Bualt15G0089100 [Buddleja alternifolia]|uniref:Transposase n=1 Tax=Buddleja alternifolia TaxID=168488 RepID=A0AAV6WPC9_9LAMI|nr:hypothetical protein BUALT_Bualt15G0089100 [Buddleja alternifolia]